MTIRLYVERERKEVEAIQIKGLSQDPLNIGPTEEMMAMFWDREIDVERDGDVVFFVMDPKSRFPDKRRIQETEWICREVSKPEIFWILSDAAFERMYEEKK